MLVKRLSRLMVVAPCVVVAFAASAQPAAAPAMPALAQIEPGLWTLQPRDGSGAARTLCVADPAALLQIQHSGARCERFVVANETDNVTVHYSCPGAGNGRTTVKVETGHLIRVDTQGIDHGAPFAFTLEGRRTGPCPGQPQPADARRR